MSSQSGGRVPSISECRKELQTVLGSSVFRHADQLSKLLEYVAEKSLSGEAELVTEYTIAVDVLGKPPGFRETRDSSVRVDVHRLRKRLGDYYTREGAGSRVRIGIPPGQYVPEFQLDGAASADAAERSSTVVGRVGNGSSGPVAPQQRTTHGWKRFPGNYLVPALATAAVVVVVGAVWLIRSEIQAARQPNASVTNVVPPATNREVHILAGYSGAAWTDAAGHRWQPDRYFTGGVSRPGPQDLRAAPPDRRLFQTMREAGTRELPEDRPAFSYDIPMQPGYYELRLYFADPLKESPREDEEDNENVRRFTVHANGRALLEQFDAVADAGYTDVDVRAFKDLTPAADGKLHLEFFPNPHRPFVNAIELVPSRPGHTNPIRIAARSSPYTDSDGKTFAPDNYSFGGRLVGHAMPLSVHDPAWLHQERYGNFSYSIPVPPGSYTLTLYFAETIFSPLAPASMCRGPGCRVFDVTCNGVNLLHDFDIFQAGGGAFFLVTRTFHDLHPNGQGKLLLGFVPSVNYAEVRAIEVVDEAP